MQVPDGEHDTSAIDKDDIDDNAQHIGNGVLISPTLPQHFPTETLTFALQPYN